ncbi:Crp/Fnr family transcriptional regulator [Candidatus Poribacteria bacterium]
MMLNTIEKVIFLQGIQEFAEIPVEQLSHIASITEEIELEPDTTLVEQDEPSEDLYFVLEGKVSVNRDGQEIMTYEENVPIGVWSLFDDERPNIATVVTLETTRLLRIHREDFLEVVADYVEITQGIFKSLARRIMKVFEQTLEQPGREDSG